MFDEDTGTVFRDVVTLALAGFVAIVVLVLPWVNPPVVPASAAVDLPGDVIFEAVWPTGVDVDVDQWVLAPGGTAVGYSNKCDAVCNLLRDDLGTQSDTLAINHEMSVCRGIVPNGEYAMNLHLYRAVSGDLPVSVSVKVSVRDGAGKARDIYTGTVELDRLGHEATVVRFELLESGSAAPGSLHHLFVPLRAKAAT